MFELNWPIFDPNFIILMQFDIDAQDTSSQRN